MKIERLPTKQLQVYKDSNNANSTRIHLSINSLGKKFYDMVTIDLMTIDNFTVVIIMRHLTR